VRKLDHGRMVMVERIADLLGERENRERRTGIEGRPGDGIDALAGGSLPADPARAGIGQARAVEQIPDGSGVVEVGEDRGQER
jgi:hypothetical protein